MNKIDLIKKLVALPDEKFIWLMQNYKRLILLPEDEMKQEVRKRFPE